MALEETTVNFVPAKKLFASKHDPETKRILQSGYTGDHLALLALAEQGVVEAQEILSQQYMAGDGIRQDFTQAAHWLKQAAKAGSTRALGNLGMLYLEGQGVEKNASKAAQCFAKAAQTEDGARYNLAQLYFQGNGVPQDTKAAAVLYRQVIPGNTATKVPASIALINILQSKPVKQAAIDQHGNNADLRVPQNASEEYEDIQSRIQRAYADPSLRGDPDTPLNRLFAYEATYKTHHSETETNTLLSHDEVRTRMLSAMETLLAEQLGANKA